MSAIEDLNDQLAKLPGIGRKTASRLTYHLLKQPKSQIGEFAAALEALAERVVRCGTCGNVTEDDPCLLCTDARRDDGTLCVVEEAWDVDAIERTGEFNGRYHVLGGHISPLDGIGPDDLALESFRQRVANGTRVREVIVATNPSMEGEATATLLKGMLEGSDIRVTRIALGLPVGGDLQYADGVTIARAFSARREMDL